MAMPVGFHVEGHDYMILQALLAKVLGLPEGDISPDWIDRPGRGWQFVVEEVPKALKRFYHQCAQFAVVGVDNDGNLDLDATGRKEDPAHPRHWNHEATVSPSCRWCILRDLISRTREELNWLPQKPGGQWPIVLAVPVEMIESWMLIAQAIVFPGTGDLRAESTPRAAQKQQLYGKPAATRGDIEQVALPLVRALNPQQIQTLAGYSRSFAAFTEQIGSQRTSILGPRDCWQVGDRASER